MIGMDKINMRSNKTYVDHDKFLQAVEAAKTAIPNKFCIVEHLVDVTGYSNLVQRPPSYE